MTRLRALGRVAGVIVKSQQTSVFQLASSQHSVLLYGNKNAAILLNRSHCEFFTEIVTASGGQLQLRTL